MDTPTTLDVGSAFLCFPEEEELGCCNKEAHDFFGTAGGLAGGGVASSVGLEVDTSGVGARSGSRVGVWFSGETGTSATEATGSSSFTGVALSETEVFVVETGEPGVVVEGVLVASVAVDEDGREGMVTFDGKFSTSTVLDVTSSTGSSGTFAGSSTTSFVLGSGHEATGGDAGGVGNSNAYFTTPGGGRA